MFFEAMEEVMPDLKIIIDNSESGTQKILPLQVVMTLSTGQLPTIARIQLCEIFFKMLIGSSEAYNALMI